MFTGRVLTNSNACSPLLAPLLRLPRTKLILRQVAPFAMLVEKAGGKTSDGVTGQSCLDIKIEAVDQVP
jgi:hypothetical protein